MNWTRLLPAALVVVLIGVFAALLLGPERAADDPLVGEAVPTVTLEALAGQPGFDPGSIEGPYLINIWGSWCPPCRAEHPMLQRLADEGVPIYGIAWRDSPENASGFLAELGNPFAGVVLDPRGELVIALGATGAPETFVVDADGIIRARYTGPLTPDAIARDIWPVWMDVNR
ncbi:MAG: thiol:disulfide interchange protein [Maricaulis sp.]|jgi:cytochrome c biogenesis protein CcmG/thiol:disulfide interchange protein DsbE|nr:thiol:disulfide interchange protein [Maricaulis sp.]HAQ35398.1 thiol:disulfide interchange protein [Alphaproteobacteria bacterium]